MYVLCKLYAYLAGPRIKLMQKNYTVTGLAILRQVSSPQQSQVKWGLMAAFMRVLTGQLQILLVVSKQGEKKQYEKCVCRQKQAWGEVTGSGQGVIIQVVSPCVNQ